MTIAMIAIANAFIFLSIIAVTAAQTDGQVRRGRPNRACFGTELGQKMASMRRIRYSRCDGLLKGQVHIFEARISRNTDLARNRGHILYIPEDENSQDVEMCLAGKSNVRRPMHGLQNSINGAVDFLGLIKPRIPFCEINLNACSKKYPKCEGRPALLPGETFCTCSRLTVPESTPNDISAEVEWKLLGLTNPSHNASHCEHSTDNTELRSIGKEILACLNIKVRLLNESARRQRNRHRERPN